MPDCTITGMRDLLPDYARGALDAELRATVAVHVAACAACERELAILEAARAVLARGPAVDVPRIVAALPKPRGAARPALSVERGGAIRPAVDSRPFRRWTGAPMRIAAAIAVMAVGGIGLRLATHPGDAVSSAPVQVGEPTPAAADHSPAPSPMPSGTPTAALPAPAGGTRQATPPVASKGTSRGVSFGGGLSDLSDGDLQALLGDLDALEAVPVAEPEPSVTPVTTGASR